MSNFTPGPWIVEKEGRSFQIFTRDEPEFLGEKMSLLTVHDEDGHHFGHVFKEEDAQLMASAPELYEALKAIKRELDARSNAQKEWLDPDIEKLIELALNKAEGKSA